jgi:hypothetical protein
MMKEVKRFMFINTDWDDFECLLIGNFYSIDEAFERASKLADDMGMDVEIYELKRVAHPSFVPSLDDQIASA